MRFRMRSRTRSCSWAGIQSRSQETRTACSDSAPRASKASAVDVSGSSACVETRTCHWPLSMTGREGVMSLQAQPMRSSGMGVLLRGFPSLQKTRAVTGLDDWFLHHLEHHIVARPFGIDKSFDGSPIHSLNPNIPIICSWKKSPVPYSGIVKDHQELIVDNNG